MADIFTPEQRSHIMSRIRGRDTKPEIALRSMLHRMDMAGGEAALAHRPATGGGGDFPNADIG